jgi:phosphoribosylanthranilate isomerase
MAAIKAKVCGMREPENIRQVAALQPDYMGFIFYEDSKRYVGEDFDPALLEVLPAGIQKVGVFVNETTQVILDKVAKYSLDLVQLHGRETPGQCSELQEVGIKIIKAFSVDDRFSFENTLLYERYCDYFLFDTRGNNYGGNGTVFDWELLKGYFSPLPYFLSGGLNLENLQSKEFEKLRPVPFAIDVNSGFEIEPGMKDVDALNKLFDFIKSK